MKGKQTLFSRLGRNRISTDLVRKVWLLAVLAWAVFGLAAPDRCPARDGGVSEAAVSSAPEQAAANTLRLGYTDFPPYLYEKPGSGPRGIIKDLWELWSLKTGIPVVFVRIRTSAVFAAVEQGRVQGITIISPFDRGEGLSLVDLPLSPVHYRLYLAEALASPDRLQEQRPGKAPDRVRIGDEEGPAGMTIGIVGDAPLPEPMKKKLGQVPIRRFETPEYLVQAALQKEVAGFVMAEATASQLLARQGQGRIFTANEGPVLSHRLSAGLSPDDPKMLEKVRAGFSRISDQEVRALVSDWTGQRQQAGWRPYTRPLRIAASIDNMPFHFADAKGKAVGMFVDLWQLWSQKTGLPVEFVPVPWARSLEMVKTGEADIHAGCFFSVQRDAYLDYGAELRDCQTHFFFHESIYGLKALTDLKGFEIGVLDQDYAVEFVRREMPGAALKIYPSHQALFKGIKAGEVKVFICDTPTAIFFLTREGLISAFRYHPSRPLYRKPFFSAVQEGNHDLIRQINQGMAAIGQEERSRIERKWMGREQETERDSLVIGIDQSFPPFSMRSADGRPSGMLVEYWRLWSRQTDQKIDFRLMDRLSGIHALKDGRIDILTGVPPASATHGWAGFARPHYRVDWYLYKPGNPKEDADWLGFTGKLGVLNHTRVYEWARNLAPEPRIESFYSAEQMLLAAGRGEIDGFMATPQEMAVLPGQLGLAGGFSRSAAPLLTLKIRAGVRNYNPALLEAIAAGFNELTQAQKAGIEANWIPEPNLRLFSATGSQIPLSPEEEQWITQHRLSGKPVRIGVRTGRPPFEFADPDGRFQGMASDMISLLALKTGLDMRADQSGEEPAPEVITSYTSVRDDLEGRVQTRPYLALPWVIITRSQAPVVTGIMDMEGKRVAVINEVLAHVTAREDWAGIRPLGVSSTAEGLEAVRLGNAHAFVDTLPAAGYHIQSKGLTGLKVAGAAAMDNDGLSFAVDKDLPLLLSILDKGIAAISPAEMSRIRQKWFAVQFEQGPDMAAVRAAAFKIAFGVGLIFLLVLLWNRMIRHREERFKCLTEQGSDIIQAFRADGTIVYASPSHESVLGRNPKAMKRRPVFEYIHPDDRNRFQETLLSLEKRGGMKTLVYRLIHADGTPFFFESHCVNLLENRAIKAFVVNGRDITQSLADRKALQEAKESAESANRSKTDFLAGLSHEVRTPLNAILGMTQATLATPLGQDQSRHLKAVLSAARHLKAVISDILDLSVIEAGKMRVQKQSLCLGEFLDTLDHTWRIETDKKGLAFSIHRAETLPDHILCDPVRLGQIMTNLMSNAVKFTRKGRISVHAAVLEREQIPQVLSQTAPGKIVLSLAVTDTGIGIDPDQAGRIFDRFARVRHSPDREQRGTGLGLAISKEMAELMGGCLTLDTRPGEGSCFTLLLPVTAGPGTDEAAADTALSSGTEVPGFDLTGTCLLLAEDDPVNRDVFTEMVKGLGCRVVYANDGSQVLDLLGSEPVDLVFMDIEMPVMDGLTATAEIRKGRAGDAFCHVPVIAMTAHALDLYREKALAAGMDGFLAKPVEVAELLAVLKEVLVPETPVLDREKALSALGGNSDLLDRVNRIFLGQVPALTADLETALADRDIEHLTIAAHTLKGVAARVYARAASEAAAALESHCRSGEQGWDSVAIHVRRTLWAVEKVVKYLS